MAPFLQSRVGGTSKIIKTFGRSQCGEHGHKLGMFLAGNIKVIGNLEPRPEEMHI